MKTLFSIFVFLACGSSFAIDFITEEQVARELRAQKVIEVSKYHVEKLIAHHSRCKQAYTSKSARAYVVKKGHRASLYMTSSSLRDLRECTEL